VLWHGDVAVGSTASSIILVANMSFMTSWSLLHEFSTGVYLPSAYLKLHCYLHCCFISPVTWGIQYPDSSSGLLSWVFLRISWLCTLYGNRIGFKMIL
jgi:hypothetical protein